MNKILMIVRNIPRYISLKEGVHVAQKQQKLQLLQAHFAAVTNKTYCTAAVMELRYEDVKVSSLEKDKLIIDVREPKELAETGVIPGSVNIPLGTVETVLKNMSDNDFLEKYGKKKPSSESPVIFSCRSGKRSLQALETAKQLGYKNVFNYTGGWLDWEEREKRH